MDSKGDGTDWAESLYNRLGSLILEVEDVITQELNSVEEQVLTAGGNVKEYYSAFLQDLLGLKEEEAVSPPELDANSGTLASQSFDTSFDAERQTGESKSETSTYELLEELIEVLKFDSLDRRNHCSEMSMGAEGDTEIEPSSSEIPEFVFSNEKLTVTSGSPDQVIIPATVSTEFQKDDLTVGSREMISAKDAKKDILTPQEFGDYISDESECRIPDIGVVSCDISLLATPDDSNDASDNGESAEMCMTNSFSEQDISPTSEELGESCIIVDDNEPFSAPKSEAEPINGQQRLRRAFLKILKFAREQRQEAASLSEDVNKGTCDPKQKDLTTTLAGGSAGSMDNQHFYESEWEII